MAVEGTVQTLATSWLMTSATTADCTPRCTTLKASIAIDIERCGMSIEDDKRKA
jgi:hypothetical protein